MENEDLQVTEVVTESLMTTIINIYMKILKMLRYPTLESMPSKGLDLIQMIEKIQKL